MQGVLRKTKLALAVASFLGVLSTRNSADAAEPRTKVILNGEVVQVTFNDGDSFRVLNGPRSGAKARLKGYNTLESYGPVHQWGTWTAKELYVMAKMATLHARRGEWTCTSDGKLDTYGRMLVDCPELAEELVRLGYAHTMSIDDEPGAQRLLAAQREAIENHRGLWSHGVPAFILTSLHSAEEDTTGGGTYNRLVSTKDAHSVKWKHDDRYAECQTVCHVVYEVDEAKVAAMAKALRSDPTAKVYVESLDDQELLAVVRDFARDRHVNRSIPKAQRESFSTVLEGYVARGALGEQAASKGACMVHVPFKRRYGNGRARCLK